MWNVPENLTVLPYPFFPSCLLGLFPVIIDQNFKRMSFSQETIFVFSKVFSIKQKENLILKVFPWKEHFLSTVSSSSRMKVPGSLETPGPKTRREILEAQEFSALPYGRIACETWVLEIQSSWTWFDKRSTFTGRNLSWPYFYWQFKALVWTVQDSRWLEIIYPVKTHKAGYSWDSNWRVSLYFSAWESRCLNIFD